LATLLVLSLLVVPGHSAVLAAPIPTTPLWSGVSPGGYERPSLALDRDGNVYVTGTVFKSASGYDFATTKYSRNGTLQWTRIWDDPWHAGDFAGAVAVDASQNVYVSGSSYDPQGTRCITLKYDKDGILQPWSASLAGNISVVDNAVDAQGNVYVTGGSGDIVTGKFDASGSVVWSARYDGPAHSDDGPRALAVDSGGNVFVTGTSSGGASGLDIVTLKYGPGSDGTEAAVDRFDDVSPLGGSNTMNTACGLALGSDGSVYVAGAGVAPPPYSAYDRSDYVLIKYDGNLHRTKVVYAPRSTSSPTALAIDASNFLYVTGEGGTVKYDADLNPRWAEQR